MYVLLNTETETPRKENPVEALVAELKKIIDRVDAAYILEEVSEGGSLAAASLYITTRELRREDFCKFRAAHGDVLTVEVVKALYNS